MTLTAPSSQEVQALIFQEQIFRVGCPTLGSCINESNQCFYRLLSQPRQLLLQRVNNALHGLFGIISLNERSMEGLYFQTGINRPTSCTFLERKLVGKDITTASNLSLFQTAKNLKTFTRSTIRTRLIKPHSQVIRQYGITRVAMRYRGNKLQFTLLTSRQNFTRHNITYQHFHIAGFVLATARAIRIVQPHLLGKAINVNHIHRINSKAVCQLLIEQFLANLLALQLLPTTNVDNLGVFRERDGDALFLNSFQNIAVKNVGKAKHHHGLIFVYTGHILLHSVHIKVGHTIFGFQKVTSF